MVKVNKLDHVAVIVRDLDESIQRYEQLFGVEVATREVVESQQTEAALLPLGNSSIELIAPRGNAGLERFLERRGPGIHHISVEVDDIEQVLAVLAAAGIALIDETPRIGARGHRVAFLHPRATGGVLVELCEPSH